MPTKYIKLAFKRFSWGIVYIKRSGNSAEKTNSYPTTISPKNLKTHSKKLQYNEPKLTQNTEAFIFLLFKKIVKYQFLWRFHRTYKLYPKK